MSRRPTAWFDMDNTLAFSDKIFRKMAEDHLGFSASIAQLMRHGTKATYPKMNHPTRLEYQRLIWESYRSIPPMPHVNPQALFKRVRRAGYHAGVLTGTYGRKGAVVDWLHEVHRAVPDKFIHEKGRPERKLEYVKEGDVLFDDSFWAAMDFGEAGRNFVLTNPYLMPEDLIKLQNFPTVWTCENVTKGVGLLETDPRLSMPQARAVA